MKKTLSMLALAAAALSPLAHADENSDMWFSDGVFWWDQPCGFEAFTRYGKADTPQNRRSYYETLKHPEMCSQLFPLDARK